MKTGWEEHEAFRALCELWEPFCLLQSVVLIPISSLMMTWMAWGMQAVQECHERGGCLGAAVTSRPRGE